MTYFLTSSPCPPDSSALNPANGFVDELKKALPETCRALFIASDPDDDVKLRRFAEDMETCEKKKLAYEISHVKGQRPETEGFYNFIKFEADVTCPAEVESRLRIMENVIRFLIVKDGE